MLVFGFALLCLGAGNWAYGASKSAQYKARQLEAIRQGGIEVSRPFRGTESILEERTEMHEYYEESVTRYRYYKAIRRGGRFMTLIGGMIMVGALFGRVVMPAFSSGGTAR